MTNEELWQAVLGEIELTLSPASFTTWFKNTAISSINGGTATVNVPNGFAKEWLENKFNAQIIRALKNFRNDIKEIRCTVVVTKKSLTKKTADSLIVQGEVREKVSSQQRESPTGTFLDSGMGQTNNNHLSLNPRYTFENFIIGSNNELARAACEAVSQNPGRVYNPLFIYGGVGLGKTHLLQSIGNSILAGNPAKKIIYSTSERFTNDLVDMIKTQNIRDFKKPYLESDLLIIDDIQFIAGKEKTQDEFFHIFNTLYQMNRQIVLSSDRPPKAISTLEERLRSRFEGGMIADVSRPDLETRMAILKAKALEKEMEIDDEALNYIASNIQHNVRELEGALNRVIVSCELKAVEPNLTNVKKILSDIISSGRKKGITFKHILQAVSEFYDINSQDLINRSRRKDIVKPRQIAMYLMRTELQTSFPGIGEQIGGRDHSTAMHAFEKIGREIEQDDSLEQDLNAIKGKVYSLSQ